MADTVRGLSVSQALARLMLIRKHAAGAVAKVIKSAAANARQKQSALTDDALMISSLQVNEGQFLKRFRASARGRVRRFKKRSSHIDVVLKEEKGESHGK